MAELKTKPTSKSVDEFLKKNADDKLEDSYKLIKMMQKITGEKPHMWGPSIIGFGSYHYKYASGHEGDMCIAGFSPRNAAFSIYLLPGFEKSAALMKKLGKYKMGKSCLYVKKLSDVDEKILEQLIEDSVRYVKSYKTFSHSYRA